MHAHTLNFHWGLFPRVTLCTRLWTLLIPLSSKFPSLTLLTEVERGWFVHLHLTSSSLDYHNCKRTNCEGWNLTSASRLLPCTSPISKCKRLKYFQITWSSNCSKKTWVHSHHITRTSEEYFRIPALVPVLLHVQAEWADTNISFRSSCFGQVGYTHSQWEQRRKGWLEFFRHGTRFEKMTSCIQEEQGILANFLAKSMHLKYLMSRDKGFTGFRVQIR